MPDHTEGGLLGLLVGRGQGHRMIKLVFTKQCCLFVPKYLMNMLLK